MSRAHASLAASLFAVIISQSPTCSFAAQWVTQPINLPTPQHVMGLAFHQANGTPYLLTVLDGTTQLATRSAPWTWSVLTPHCGPFSNTSEAAIDNLGGVHSIFHDAVGNVSVHRTVGPTCGGEPLETTFQFGTSITTSPTTQVERVLVRRVSPGEPNRVSLRLREWQGPSQWSDVPVQAAAFDVSFDEPNAMTTDSNNDWWIATPVHYIASPTFQEVRLYHVGQSIVLDPLLIQVDFVRALKMRVAGGGTGPVMALEYAGIQPATGQIAIFWRGALGWTFADVDSNSIGTLDVAMTISHQYVAYMKEDPLKGAMVCVASRTIPDIGTRPFGVDTLIRAGHLGNGRPIKVAVFVDSQDRPVVLTLVSAQDPGEVNRIYESILIDPTTSVPAVETASRRASALTVSPNPVRLSGVLGMAVSIPSKRIYIADLAGRMLHSIRADEARKWEYPAAWLFKAPGIYFVVAEGTELGRIVRRVVVTD